MQLLICYKLIFLEVFVADYNLVLNCMREKGIDLENLNQFHSQNNFKKNSKDYYECVSQSKKHSIASPIFTKKTLFFGSLAQPQNELAENDLEEKRLGLKMVESLLNQKKYDDALKVLDLLEKAGASLSEVYLYQGRAWYGKQRYDQSILILTKAIEAYPDFHELYLWRARSYRQIKSYQKSNEDWKDYNTQKARNRVYSGHSTTFERAVAAFDAQDYKTAQDGFLELLALPEDMYPEVLLYLARICYLDSQTCIDIDSGESLFDTRQKAVDYILRSYDHLDDNNINYYLAEAYINFDNYNAYLLAIENLDRFLKNNPNHIPALKLKLLCLKKTSQFEKREALVDRLLEIDENNIDFILERIEIIQDKIYPSLFNLTYEEALELIDEMIYLYNQVLKYHDYRSDLYEERLQFRSYGIKERLRQDFDVALDEYEILIRQDPSFLKSRADFYWHILHDYEKSRADMDDVLKFYEDKNDGRKIADTIHDRAWLNYHMGDYEQALKDLSSEHTIYLTPSNEDLIVLSLKKARILACQGQSDQVHQEIDRAESLLKENSSIDERFRNEFYESLAEIYFLMGEFDRALFQFKRSSSGSYAQNFFIGVTLYHDGQKREARPYFQKAHELFSSLMERGFPETRSAQEMNLAAVLLIYLERYDDALSLLKELVEREVNFFRKEPAYLWASYYWMGLIYEIQGDQDLAKQNYDAALSFNKDNKFVLYRKAVVLYRGGKIQEAKDLLIQAKQAKFRVSYLFPPVGFYCDKEIDDLLSTL